MIVRANTNEDWRLARSESSNPKCAGERSLAVLSCVGDAQADARNVGGAIPSCAVPLSGPVRRSDTDADESRKAGSRQYRHRLNFFGERI